MVTKKSIKKNPLKRPSPKKTVTIHPMAAAINNFLNAVDDIKFLSKLYYPASLKYLKEKGEALQKDINEIIDEIKSKKTTDAIIVKKIQKYINARNNELRIRMPQILQTSLFNSLFSEFDTFQSDILSSLYTKKQELYSKINKSYSVNEIVSCNSIDEIKANALMEEIETFRRKSYVEQFEDLERCFGLKLKNFKRWSQFVECSQRRNLLTHCNGTVSRQYLKICKENGHDFSSPVKIGEKLSIDNKYFLASCNMLAEVAFSLCHTLWRKVLPEELSEADEWLNKTIFDTLSSEDWKRSQVFGEFAISLPRFSSDVIKKMVTMNYAMSLKFDRQEKKSEEILNSVDCSASSYDFKMADAILRNDFDKAIKLMKAMGKEGELIDETSYYTWPLFHEFRQSDQFLKTFGKIYNHPFANELQKKAAN
ncbi:MAG: hypothetical protein ACLQSX_07930 [Smithella sp.]